MQRVEKQFVEKENLHVVVVWNRRHKGVIKFHLPLRKCSYISQLREEWPEQ